MPGCPRLAVKEVQIAGPIAVVGPDDFVTEPAGEIEAQRVLSDPRYSLYCFDPEANTAHFVELKDKAAAESVPFYYQGQREQAMALIKMPMETFIALSKQIAPPAKSLIFVHSVGRCGSTLLSKVLESVPSVHSLSEPDDLTQLGRIWTQRIWSEDEVRKALEAGIAWRCRPICEHVALKPRSEVLAMADLLGPTFPSARHLFVYRDGLAWMRTIFRGVPLDRDVYDPVRNLEWEKMWANSLPLIGELLDEAHPKNIVQTRILGWASSMEGYLKLVATTVPTCAVRFEDLTANPLPVLCKVMEFCFIEDVDWDAVDEVLGKDSQAGTVYDREKRRALSREMTEDLVQDLYAMLANRPLLGRPDVILPGTIAV